MEIERFVFTKGIFFRGQLEILKNIASYIRHFRECRDKLNFLGDVLKDKKRVQEV